MSSDPLTPIWTRLDAEPPVFFADRPDPAFEGVREQLIGLSFLRPIDPSRFAVCTGCGGGHVRLVAWVEDARTGGRRAYVPCPECGAVPVEPDHLRRWEIDVPRLLAGVFVAAGGRVAVGEVVPGRLWYLGAAVWGGYSRQAYFARFVHGPARAAVHAALAGYPRAVLFHPTERAARTWGDATPNPAVSLESVVALGPGGIVFDAAAVEGRLADAVPVAPEPDPVPKRASRAAGIERLTREVRQILRDARENWYATLALGRPTHLPRPTQKELAARSELTESDVSRCLKDPEAVLLRLLWETAGDPDKILAWDGSVGGGPP